MCYQISKCITNDCLNNSDYSYDLFGIILEIILMSQLLIHLMFPLYKCYTKEQNEVDENLQIAVGRLKKVYIIFNSLIIYNIFFVKTIPQTSLYAIYYALLIITMLLTLSFLQLKSFESLFSVNLYIFSLISMHLSTLLNLFIIIYDKNDFIPTSINFGFLLTTCLLSIYCINNIMNTYSKLKSNNVDEDPEINNLINKYTGYTLMQEPTNHLIDESKNMNCETNQGTDIV